MMQAIKYSPFSLCEDTIADRAFQTLRAPFGPTVLDYVSMIHFTIARTRFIPTKRTSYC